MDLDGICCWFNTLKNSSPLFATLVVMHGAFMAEDKTWVTYLRWEQKLWPWSYLCLNDISSFGSSQSTWFVSVIVPIRFMVCSSLKPIETAESIQESGKHDWTWYLDNFDKDLVMGDSQVTMVVSIPSHHINRLALRWGAPQGQPGSTRVQGNDGGSGGWFKDR